MSKPDAPAHGTCHFCEKKLDQEHYCFGCEKFICDKCDVNLDLFGSHDPMAHRIDEEDLEEDEEDD